MSFKSVFERNPICITLRQFICPLSLFLKEIPFASLTNAIDVKIERVLTGFLIGWTICFSQSKSPLELSRQVVFLSKETPIVSVDLRTAEVSYTNQNKTAWKSEVVVIVFWGPNEGDRKRTYIPRLFSAFMLTFRVE
jgi:hypothetical protein